MATHADTAQLIHELILHRYRMSDGVAQAHVEELDIPGYLALHRIADTAANKDDPNGRTYLQDLADNMQVSVRQVSKLAEETNAFPWNKQVASELRTIQAKAKDDQDKKILERLIDAAAFSNPKQYPASESLEKQIVAAVGELESSLGDAKALNDKAQALFRLFNQRNILVKNEFNKG